MAEKNSAAGESLALPRLCLTRFDSPLTRCLANSADSATDAYRTCASGAHRAPVATRAVRSRPLHAASGAGGMPDIRMRRSKSTPKAGYGCARTCRYSPALRTAQTRSRWSWPVFRSASISNRCSRCAIRARRPRCSALRPRDADDAGSVLRAWVAAEARLKAGPDASRAGLAVTLGALSTRCCRSRKPAAYRSVRRDDRDLQCRRIGVGSGLTAVVDGVRTSGWRSVSGTR